MRIISALIVVTAFGGTSSIAQPLQLVFPSSISPKYANEDGGHARMHTCLDQYIANKPNNANGGLNWIQKGSYYFDGHYIGGYFVECNQHLKLPQISAPVPPGPRIPAPQIAKKPEPESFSGTAFFVSSEGKALTNAHVVQGCRQISVNKDGRTSPAKLVASDERNDLALLETDVNPIQAAKWRFRVRLGEEIVVYGFPLTRVLASTGNVNSLHAFRMLQPVRYLLGCSGFFRLERSPGGPRTHWKVPPCHGAHP